MTLKSCAAINNEGHPSKRGALQVIKTELFLWSNEKSPQFFTAAISILVDLIGIEPTTLRMRTVRSPKRESYMSPKVGQKNSKNRNKQSKISGTVCIFVI